jgi:hypothetical protein
MGCRRTAASPSYEIGRRATGGGSETDERDRGARLLLAPKAFETRNIPVAESPPNLPLQAALVNDLCSVKNGSLVPRRYAAPIHAAGKKFHNVIKGCRRYRL